MAVPECGPWRETHVGAWRALISHAVEACPRHRVCGHKALMPAHSTDCIVGQAPDASKNDMLWSVFLDVLQTQWIMELALQTVG
eukprot:COSAG02_NODE_612_length_19541_cov_13.245150_5_plen_84_part_00